MILRRDDHNTSVALWQSFLVKRGFTVTPDSHFGPNTEAATRAFQNSVGLRGDGIAGPNTFAEAEKLGFAGFDDEATTETLVEKIVSIPANATLALFEGTRIDQINAAKLAKVSPTLQTRGRLFIDAAKADGVVLQCVQGLRTFAEQDALYAQGRSKPGKKVTNARGGQSNHNFALALDFAPVVDGEVSWDEKLFRPFGEWADIAGLSWGGRWSRFKDLPHVELKDIPKFLVLQEWYRQGGLAEVWKHFD